MSSQRSAERFFGWVFSWFVWLDGIREARPGTFYWLARIPIFLLGSLLSVCFKTQGILNPSWWPTAFPAVLSLSNIIAGTVGLGSGFIVSIVGVRFILPMLIYAPQALAMRTLGLYRVTTDPVETLKLITKCAERHDQDKRVQILCISGKHLFREPKLILGNGSFDTPLHDLARMGMIEAIFPESCSSNCTIHERYLTYSDGYKSEQDIPEIQKFLQEIDDGKRFLLKNSDNLVFEHNMLCAWRIIIFSKHCVIQTYFPNAKKGHSYEAPTFVYSKVADDEVNSYYAVYKHLFDMIKSRSKPVDRKRLAPSPTAAG
jgi:hypothetical protein